MLQVVRLAHGPQLRQPLCRVLPDHPGSEGKAVVPAKLFSVTTEATGSLHAQAAGALGFAVGVVFRSYMEKAREVKQFGVIPHKLSYDMLTARYFTERPSIYQKVLVKLDGANINDTIRFDYKGRQYEAFIREILPTGLDWYAVAFVVESEKPASTIIIKQHDFVDMKRVVKIGPDAFSIKDIIRMVQQQKDPAKPTTQDDRAPCRRLRRREAEAIFCACLRERKSG